MRWVLIYLFEWLPAHNPRYRPWITASNMLH